MRQMQITNPSMLRMLYDLFSKKPCYMLHSMSLHHQLVNAMNAQLCQVQKDLALFKDWDLMLKSSSVELMSDATLSSEFTKCTAFTCNMLQVATVVNIHIYIYMVCVCVCVCVCMHVYTWLIYMKRDMSDLVISSNQTVLFITYHVHKSAHKSYNIYLN